MGIRLGSVWSHIVHGSRLVSYVPSHRSYVRASVLPIMNALLAIGEVPSLLWLLIRGARNPARNEGATEPA